MSEERRHLGTRTARLSAGLLLLLAIALFLAGAISVAGTFLGDPEDRALGPDRAVLGMHVSRAGESGPGEGGHHTGDHDGRHPPPRGVFATVTISTGGEDGRERTLRTDRQGFLHVDVHSGTYTVKVSSRDGNGSTEVVVRGITFVKALVQDDGSIDFEVERHRAHHPPFPHMASDAGPHRPHRD